MYQQMKISKATSYVKAKQHKYLSAARSYYDSNKILEHTQGFRICIIFARWFENYLGAVCTRLFIIYSTKITKHIPLIKVKRDTV